MTRMTISMNNDIYEWTRKLAYDRHISINKVILDALTLYRTSADLTAPEPIMKEVMKEGENHE